MTPLPIWKWGMPWRSNPPMRSAFSKTVTLWPARASCWAAARPAGPEPTTATVLPVRTTGRTGATQPSSNPLSMMFHSMIRMDTGSLLIPRTQADSQGAGHRRPVNSGKVLGPGLGAEFPVLMRLALGGRRLPNRQHSFVIDRHKRDELRQHRRPGVEHEVGLAAAGVLEVRLYHVPQGLLVLGGDDLLQLDHAHVAA